MEVAQFDGTPVDVAGAYTFDQSLELIDRQYYFVLHMYEEEEYTVTKEEKEQRAILILALYDFNCRK